VPTFVAHNPIQQLAYSGLYVLAVLQAMTGLALYGMYHPRGWLWKWFQWPVHWLGAPDVRLLHFLLMWGFWIFLVAHIYMVIRADTMERNGGLSAMLGGSIWLKRGVAFADAPDGFGASGQGAGGLGAGDVAGVGGAGVAGDVAGVGGLGVGADGGAASEPADVGAGTPGGARRA
jgi:hypothetical protein